MDDSKDEIIFRLQQRNHELERVLWSVFGLVSSVQFPSTRPFPHALDHLSSALGTRDARPADLFLNRTAVGGPTHPNPNNPTLSQSEQRQNFIPDTEGQQVQYSGETVTTAARLIEILSATLTIDSRKPKYTVAEGVERYFTIILAPIAEQIAREQENRLGVSRSGKPLSQSAVVNGAIGKQILEDRTFDGNRIIDDPLSQDDVYRVESLMVKALVKFKNTKGKERQVLQSRALDNIEIPVPTATVDSDQKKQGKQWSTRTNYPSPGSVADFSHYDKATALEHLRVLETTKGDQFVDDDIVCLASMCQSFEIPEIALCHRQYLKFCWIEFGIVNSLDCSFKDFSSKLFSSICALLGCCALSGKLSTSFLQQCLAPANAFPSSRMNFEALQVVLQIMENKQPSNEAMMSIMACLLRVLLGPDQTRILCYSSEIRQLPVTIFLHEILEFTSKASGKSSTPIQEVAHVCIRAHLTRHNFARAEQVQVKNLLQLICKHVLGQALWTDCAAVINLVKPTASPVFSSMLRRLGVMDNSSNIIDVPPHAIPFSDVEINEINVGSAAADRSASLTPPTVREIPIPDQTVVNKRPAPAAERSAAKRHQNGQGSGPVTQNTDVSIAALPTALSQNLGDQLETSSNLHGEGSAKAAVGTLFIQVLERADIACINNQEAAVEAASQVQIGRRGGKNRGSKRASGRGRGQGRGK